MSESDDLSVRISWKIVCHHCQCEHHRVRTIHGPNVEHAPPPIPAECTACRSHLRREPHSWSRTFEIKGYLAHAE